jgi:DNA polymerase/3'-5' exonuclease PolX
MLPLERAEAVADDVLQLLAPACHRIMIAGSIRRRARQVNDVELVAIPRYRFSKIPGNLFGEIRREGSELAFLIDTLASRDETRLTKGVRDGDRQKQLLWTLPGMDEPLTIDLFCVEAERDWGAILAIRTGSAEFARRCVMGRHLGGAMPADMQQRERRLWRNNVPLDTPTEESWFAALGLPHWKPEERTDERLQAWLAKYRGVVARR